VDELASWVGDGYPMAFRTACLILRNPADAEEAVQEAFLRVWRFRAAIPPPPARNAWLYRVVVNSCLSRLRADARRPRTGDGAEVTHLPAPDPDPGQAAEHAGLAAAVLGALADLPEHLRVPLVLRYYSGLAEREIATAIQRRPGTVKSRLAEARRRLALDPALAAWVQPEEEAR